MFTPRATSSPQQPGTLGWTVWVKQHALLAYVLLTFGLTWPVMLAEVLGSWGVIPFRLTLSGTGLLLTLFMGYGPTLAALIVTGTISGRAGIRTLLGRLLIWRVGWQWYAATILIPGIVGLLATELHALRTGSVAVWPAFSWGMLLTFPVAFLVRGIVNGEEIGWRGFALPHLQQRWNALTASLILGGVWALFHLPIFFVQGASILGSQNTMNPLTFLIDIALGSILVTWLCNNTRGSLLIAYLYHAAVNTWTSEVFRSTGIEGTLIMAVIVVIVVISFGPARLTRKPVGTKLF